MEIFRQCGDLETISNMRMNMCRLCGKIWKVMAIQNKSKIDMKYFGCFFNKNYPKEGKLEQKQNGNTMYNDMLPNLEIFYQ